MPPTTDLPNDCGVPPDMVDAVAADAAADADLVIGFFRAVGQIPIDRTNLRDAFAAYDAAALAIRGGLSAIVFAEGTRSRDGSLREFKKGPFVLAIAAGAPVVPVLIQGTRDVLPPGGWWVHPGRVRVKLAPPVPTSGLSYENRDEVLGKVRAGMLAE